MASLAAQQHSVFHRRHAIYAGLTPRMIDWRLRTGRWIALYRGVYRLAGATGTWQQKLMAACLAAGPGAVVSHRSAAALWSMDGFLQGPIEISVLGSRRTLHGVIVRRTRCLEPGDTTSIDGVPVTTVARTLIDLAAVAAVEDLEAALDWALREQRTTVSYLRRRIAALGGRGRVGTEGLGLLLADRELHGGFESRRERALAATLIAAGLPEPERQYRLLDGTGKLVARFDLALPAAQMAFEFDSYRHHFGRRAWRSDTSRDNAATAHGWLVFRLTEDDLRHPDSQLLADVTATYRARAKAATRPENQRTVSA